MELNPGPAKIEDVLHRIDALIAELADTRAALERKIDAAIQDIAIRGVTCEKNLSNIDVRLAKLEATLAFTSTEVNTLKADVTAWPKLGALSATAPALSKEVPNNVSNLIHEINLRNDKKVT